MQLINSFCKKTLHCTLQFTLHSHLGHSTERMGNFLHKRDPIEEITERVSQLSKTSITSALDYNAIVKEMFEDKISTGRVTVFVMLSYIVRDHLPLSEHGLINHYFWNWITYLERKLPRENFMEIKQKWSKSGWRLTKIYEQSTL